MDLPKHAIIVKMNDLTKKIYSWDIAFSEQHNVQTWASEIRDILLSHNLANCFDPGMNFCSQGVIVKLKESTSVKQSVELQNECQEKPKLRTFITRLRVNTQLYNNAYAIFKTQIFSTFSALKSCD